MASADGAGLNDGPVFRAVTRRGHVGGGRLDARAVSRLVKKAAVACGLNPDKYAAHSLRTGLATEAIRNGAAEKDVMQQTGHRSAAMLLRYVRRVRRVRAWDSPASAKLGL